MVLRLAFVVMLAAMAPAFVPAWAQSGGMEEIVVTAARIDSADELVEEFGLPAVGIYRQADYVLQQARVSNDSLSPLTRRQEIHETLLSAVKIAAENPAIELAFLDGGLVPMSEENYKLSLTYDSRRTDTNMVTIYVKVPLKGSRQQAENLRTTIDDFVEAIDAKGRTSIRQYDELELSMADPRGLRGEIIKAITTDVKTITAQLGDGYAAYLDGLNNPVVWERSGLTQLFIYVPYRMTIQPKPVLGQAK